MARHFRNDLAPGAAGHFWIMRRGIGPREGEVEDWLLVGFVLRVVQLSRGVFVLGAEAALLPGLIILPVKNAVAALEDLEFGSHFVLHVVRLSPPKFFRYRVASEQWRSGEGVLRSLKLC